MFKIWFIKAYRDDTSQKRIRIDSSKYLPESCGFLIDLAKIRGKQLNYRRLLSLKLKIIE